MVSPETASISNGSIQSRGGTYSNAGASTTPGLYLLPPIVGRFCDQYPQVELHYVVENSARIEQKVLKNELDVGFVGTAPSSEFVQGEPVVRDEIVCFASSSHPLARRRHIDPVSLENEKWVIRENGAATRQLFEAWLGSVGGKVGRTIALHCPETIKALVAAGVGFSYMSAYALRSKGTTARLKQLDIAGLHLTRPHYLIRHVDTHLSAMMEQFLKNARNTTFYA